MHGHMNIKLFYQNLKKTQTRVTIPWCCIRYGILAEEIALNQKPSFRALIAGVIGE
jgi:hypothetical protein